jgi:hypothetical protein
VSWNAMLFDGESINLKANARRSARPASFPVRRHVPHSFNIWAIVLFSLFYTLICDRWQANGLSF